MAGDGAVERVRPGLERQRQLRDGVLPDGLALVDLAVELLVHLAGQLVCDLNDRRAEMFAPPSTHGDAEKMRSLYRKILARDPSPKELDLAVSYLTGGTVEQYAQVLLSTNEEIFWP